MADPFYKIKHYSGKIWRRIALLLAAIKLVLIDGHTPRYALRLANEKLIYNDCAFVHELPEIFHYWSNKHLAPNKFHPFGITDPEQFFYLYTEKMLDKCRGKNIFIASIGSGNCDMEVNLIKKLLDAGYTDFHIECIDINKRMLARGVELAIDAGVEAHFLTTASDFNSWKPKKKYDVIIANQCLHHVTELEHLFGSIKTGLTEDGYFLVSDMIGRNGHQRWPEAMNALAPFWQELPESYRYNRLLNRQENDYINHDSSTRSFEGVRAQDILPLLLTYYHFELFIPFANIILVFIDRPFGHNFDASADWDRDFIDRVHARDEQAILSGELTPTQMLAVLKKTPTTTQLTHPQLTPEFCARHPD